MADATQKKSTSKLKQELLSVAGFTPSTDDRGRSLPDSKQRQLREEVHFNPETLDISFTNSIQKGRSKQPAQTVSETTAKLSVELVFDTTFDGTDVRTKTVKIARFMDPDQKTVRRKKKNPKTGKSATRTTKKKIPAIVVFQWGTIWFEGYIDSFKEKLELFSSKGIPLRSVVSISMTQQQRNVDPLANDNALAAQKNSGGDLALHNNVITLDDPVQPNPENQSVTQTAQNMGDPNATRRIATQNGIENIRFPEVDLLAITDELQRLTQPIALFGVDAAVTAGASARRFSGLHGTIASEASLTPRPGLRFDPTERRDRGLAIGPNTVFGVGGNVKDTGSASLSADVGADTDLELDIHFEE